MKLDLLAPQWLDFFTYHVARFFYQPHTKSGLTNEPTMWLDLISTIWLDLFTHKVAGFYTYKWLDLFTHQVAGDWGGQAYKNLLVDVVLYETRILCLDL